MAGRGVFWSMGQRTHAVPVSMYAEHRAKLCASLHRDGLLGVVLLQGGTAAMRHETDHEDLFRQESFLAYLFGVREPGFYGTLDVTTGVATLFAPRLPAEYAVWMGPPATPEELTQKYGVDAVKFTDELGASLEQAQVIHLLCGVNTDSGEATRPAQFPGLESLGVELDKSQRLHAALCECRAIKTAAEVEVLRYVCRVSSDAHVAVMRAAKAGMHEYQLEALFMFHCYTHGGCRHVSYTCICATGPRSAVLHYGHAGAPNDQELQPGSLALLDMGAEYACYGADITCTFPVSGTFTADQALVYNAVLDAQRAVFACLRPGVEWADMHRLAERTILAALTRGGLLIGCVDDQQAAHLGAVFMPHGLGHLLGCDTHDPGGYPAGAQRIAEPGICKLRMNRKLLAGMVLTVEPGCYFVKPLLEAARGNAVQAPFLVNEALERFAGFGGVRLEDDVLITADGYENLTHCPRTVEEVEAVMAGGPWPQ